MGCGFDVYLPKTLLKPHINDCQNQRLSFAFLCVCSLESNVNEIFMPSQNGRHTFLEHILF